MFKNIAVVAVAAIGITGAANAATLSGVFDVTVVHNTGLNSAESAATGANFLAASGRVGAQGDDFVYDGDIDFATTDGTDATTIADWLASGSGTVTDLDAVVGALQQSTPNINNGSATTSFYLFELRGDVGAGTFDVTHDDGIELYDDGISFAGFAGPNGQRNEVFSGFDGGAFSFLYVATNGDPSILNIDADLAPVPLPAALPLLLAGIGGLGFVGRRRAKAKAAA